MYLCCIESLSRFQLKLNFLQIFKVAHMTQCTFNVPVNLIDLLSALHRDTSTTSLTE